MFNRILTTAVSLVLFLAGLISIAVGCQHLITNDLALAGTGLGSGLVLLFAATIDRFEKLKGMSMEVTTRRLDAKIVEADNKIRELKELAEVFGYSMSLAAAKIGRFDSSFTFDEGYDLTKKVRKNLTDLECDDRAIAKALHPWVRISMIDLGNKLLEPVNSKMRNQCNSIIEEINATPQPVDASNEKYCKLIESMRVLADYFQPGLQIHLLDTTKVLSEISRYISQAPIAQEDKNNFLKDVSDWSDEIRHLLEYSDIKNPVRWSELLNTSP